MVHPKSASIRHNINNLGRNIYNPPESHQSPGILPIPWNTNNLPGTINNPPNYHQWPQFFDHTSGRRGNVRWTLRNQSEVRVQKKSEYYFSMHRKKNEEPHKPESAAAPQRWFSVSWTKTRTRNYNCDSIAVPIRNAEQATNSKERWSEIQAFFVHLTTLFQNKDFQIILDSLWKNPETLFMRSFGVE